MGTALEKYRNSYPEKSDEQLFEILSDQLKDKIETIHQNFKRIKVLEEKQPKMNRKKCIDLIKYVAKETMYQTDLSDEDADSILVDFLFT